MALGGQAVIEGIMMRNNEKYAIACRDNNGNIVTTKDSYEGFKINIPIIRGIAGFISSIILGMKALDFSARVFDDEGDIGEGFMTLSFIISFLFAIFVFTALPYILTIYIFKSINNNYIISLIEGIVRLSIFLLYLFAISNIKDIRRVLMYHGAEHKCINCIESNMDLNVENVRKSSRFHSRCGTGFLLYIVIISMILFMFIDVRNVILRVIIRLILVPIIIGIAYEVLKLSSKSNSKIVKVLIKPALFLQRLTTREPDDSMIEVAIEAVNLVR